MRSQTFPSATLRGSSMHATNLPIGCFVRIDKPDLQAVIDRLKALGYRVIGPTVSQASIIYDEIDSLRDLPIGLIDVQDAATYRLVEADGVSYFDYVVGPHS